jgi:hypothetical protein
VADLRRLAPGGEASLEIVPGSTCRWCTKALSTTVRTVAFERLVQNLAVDHQVFTMNRKCTPIRKRAFRLQLPSDRPHPDSKKVPVAIVYSARKRDQQDTDI